MKRTKEAKKLEDWKVGKIITGRMEEKTGRMEGWKGGRVEEGKDGRIKTRRLEEGKNGRFGIRAKSQRLKAET